jgi:hypothetical protein
MMDKFIESWNYVDKTYLVQASGIPHFEVGGSDLRRLEVRVCWSCNANTATHEPCEYCGRPPK